MRVKFQYVDWTEWEGPPNRAYESPDKGVIRMWAFTDTGRSVVFVYDDFYFLYPESNGSWIFASGTPKREHRFTPGADGTTCVERPVIIPKNAILRKGQTVSQEEAVRFGLIQTVDEKTLHAKRDIPIERGR